MSGSLELTTETLAPWSALLSEAGLAAKVLSATSCTQGRNNRTYRVETTQGSYIIKAYLRQAGDLRDRLASEFAFLSYARQVAPAAVAAPLYQNVQHGLALYEFIDGQPLQPGEVTAAEVKQAAQFFCALNEARAREQALSLPLASEACFSIQEHFNLIESRIALLEKIEMEASEDKQASALVSRLSRYWRQLESELSQTTRSRGLNLQDKLEAGQRCISPSDFGFHNALKRKDGRLCFVDFEYAGWDDPAKMTGDFFSQLALPVPGILFNDFVSEVMQPFIQPEALIYRAHCLRLVYRVKWCCIALNIFLPTHLARYRFANPALDVRDFKQKQLLKAETLIQSLESFNYGLH